MTSPLIVVLNESTAVSDADCQAFAAAANKAAQDVFAKAYGYWGRVKFWPKAKGAPPSNAWQLGFFDNSDQAGALGYHDATPAGLPLGKAFAGTDKQYGYDPNVTASHELWEMLGDPDIVRVYQIDDKTFGAYELSDPVEADDLAFDVDGVKLSDFVYPAWFESYNQDGPFDHTRAVTKPFSMAQGGYVSVWTPTTGWTQKFADEADIRYAARPRVGSRRERRRTKASGLWLPSATEVGRAVNPEEIA